MRILISADMEGITGVTTWEQVTPGHSEYSRFRRLMTEDVNAAVRGAIAGGADEIIVTDGHSDGSNILIEELDSRVRLNSGAPSPLSMMQGIDRGIDGVIFLGYHARHGSPNAVLDHTWLSTCVQNVWVNEMLAGEYTLNAAMAGHFGVPVIMATGDQTACSQIAEQLGPVMTVVVKQASGRFSAECLPPVVTRKLIEQGALQAVQQLSNKIAPTPFVVGAPVRVTVELKSSDMTDRASLMPGTARDGLRLSFTADDMLRAFAGFRALVSLSYPR